MTWFSRNLGDGMLAHALLDNLADSLSSAYAKADCPKDMAVFFRHESDGRLHCEVMVYFSPASAAAAREVNAEPCVKPSPADLGLLAGCEDSWLVLFPECRP